MSRAYTTALATLPIMVINNIRLRPYLSDKAPILGDTMNCKVLRGRIQWIDWRN